MISVLVPPAGLVPGGVLQLEPEEAHHLRVRRVAAGERLRLLDGVGGVGQGTFGPDAAGATVRVDQVDRVEPPRPLRLLVGAGDRDRFGWLAEKCAETGVTELHPVESARAQAVAARLRPAHLERLARRARGAIKQSGAAWAPVVGALASLEEAIARAGDGPRWLADAAGEPAGGMAAPPVAVAIGPEGGFTPEERALLVQAGFLPVRLGPHVMRFETAAVAAAVLARSAQPGAVHE